MSDDPLDELLGIDLADPVQNLARELVNADDVMMQELHRARRESGLSVEQVAERMGTLPHRVRHLEFADADPRLSTVRRYALAIGVMVQHEVTTAPEAPSEASQEGIS